MAHFSKNCGDSMLVAAKILLVLRVIWNFFIDKGTIFLFDDIPDSILLLDLSRFGLVLCCVLRGACWFFEAPFNVPSDCLKSQSSVEKDEKTMKVRQTALISWGRSDPCCSRRFLLCRMVLAAISTTPFRAFSFLAVLYFSTKGRRMLPYTSVKDIVICLVCKAG